MISTARNHLTPKRGGDILAADLETGSGGDGCGKTLAYCPQASHIVVGFLKFT
jgi:hypothetical protein